MAGSVISKYLMALVSILAGWIVCVHAEDAYEIMTGGVSVQPAPSVPPVLAYGDNAQIAFPPKLSPRPHRAVPPDTSSYCVRICDGRYFPASSINNESRAEGCSNLCPASETAVFYGSSIERASTKDGKLYSALPDAFRYRRELVPGCTCNGKDVIGLAQIKIEDDRTIRRGDMIASKDGLEVVRSNSDRQLRLSVTSLSDTTRRKGAAALVRDR
jgi:hypothetical protein